MVRRADLSCSEQYSLLSAAGGQVIEACFRAEYPMYQVLFGRRSEWRFGAPANDAAPAHSTIDPLRPNVTERSSAVLGPVTTPCSPGVVRVPCPRSHQPTKAKRRVRNSQLISDLALGKPDPGGRTAAGTRRRTSRPAVRREATDSVLPTSNANSPLPRSSEVTVASGRVRWATALRMRTAPPLAAAVSLG